MELCYIVWCNLEAEYTGFRIAVSSVNGELIELPAKFII